MSLAEQRKLLKKTDSANLCFLGGPFLVENGRRLEVPEGGKRLLVFVTLNGGRVSRRRTAGTLWPNGDDERAAGNLRSALWRLRRAGVEVLHADRSTLYLNPEVSVDIIQLSQWATRIIDGNSCGSDLEPFDLNPEALNLLPGWYDDWVILEREHLRQRLLHGLEVLVNRLISRGLFAAAVQAAITAVAMEPLRESAQRVLIEAYLAEGNLVEARRAYVAYHDMLTTELGVSPGVELAMMVSRRQDIIQQRHHDFSISYATRGVEFDLQTAG